MFLHSRTVVVSFVTRHPLALQVREHCTRLSQPGVGKLAREIVEIHFFCGAPAMSHNYGRPLFVDLDPFGDVVPGCALQALTGESHVAPVISLRERGFGEADH